MSKIVYPGAYSRLNSDIFVKEYAKKLPHNECSVCYVNKEYSEYFTNPHKLISDFGYTLCSKEESDIVVFADKQKDDTDIALSGNLGSGRACYVGNNYNVKGIGRTQLAKANPNSQHGNGRLDLATALKEAVMSQYICTHTQTKTSPVIGVIGISYFTKYDWSDEPLQNALLIREDAGTLDRISHALHSDLNVKPDLDCLTKKLAVFDAELFSHKLLHGAWSAGNISVNGNWLDMESVSFTPDRGAYSNITKKYISNVFGYEGIGAICALNQHGSLTGECVNEEMFYATRLNSLVKEFSFLTGICANSSMVSDWEFLSKLSCSAVPTSVFSSTQKSGLLDLDSLLSDATLLNISSKDALSHICTSDLNDAYFFTEDDAKLVSTHIDSSVIQKTFSDFHYSLQKAGFTGLPGDKIKTKLGFLGLTEKINELLELQSAGELSNLELVEVLNQDDLLE